MVCPLLFADRHANQGEQQARAGAEDPAAARTRQCTAEGTPARHRRSARLDARAEQPLKKNPAARAGLRIDLAARVAQVGRFRD